MVNRMNRESIILTIKNMDDINKMNKDNVKYINIDIKNVDVDVINYLKNNGHNYLYSEVINNKNGYIYVDYNTFFGAEERINNIISKMPLDLSLIEKAKYLYISLGKMLSYDINVIPEKNDVFSFVNINTINNIWGSMYNLKATNQSYCKLYLYLCSLVGIDCDIISVDSKGFLCNKININKKSLIVNLTEDVPFIECGFKTRYFSNYNDELDIDKKIGYICDSYCENKLDNVLCSVDQEDDNFVYDFLISVQNHIDIDNVSPIELGIIFDYLFSKYCSGINVHINNLYLNGIYNDRKHFILISYNDNYYCYNYNKGSFVNISEKDLVENIENEKIGVYLNEDMPIMYKYKEVV